MNQSSSSDGVLVIMPMKSDPMNAERRSAIEDGLRRAGMQASFPVYDTADPRFDLEEFVSALRSAHSVLADLTGERPSCYYELAFAEALARPISLVAETGTPIHQSSHRSDVLFYSNMKELEDLVAHVFEEEHKNRSYRDNHDTERRRRVGILFQ